VLTFWPESTWTKEKPGNLAVSDDEIFTSYLSAFSLPMLNASMAVMDSSICATLGRMTRSECAQSRMFQTNRHVPCHDSPS